MSRRLAAQLALGIVALSMVALTWGVFPADGSAGSAPTFATESRRGIGVAEGQFVLLLAIIGMLLAQVGFRPAWMAAGLAVAALVRSLIEIGGDDHAEPGAGLWVGLVAALVASALLIWDMVASIERTPVDIEVT